jgi:hypothetical protein
MLVRQQESKQSEKFSLYRPTYCVIEANELIFATKRFWFSIF